MFVEVAEVLREVEREDLVEFIEGRVAILDKKTATKSKATLEKQAENQGIKDEILSALTEFGKAVNITELKTYGNLGQYSTPKISALLKQMKDDGLVVRTLEKKTPYFAVA
jgi:hypothetical protein